MPIIRLYCQQGATTKMLTDKITAYVAKKGYDIDVAAAPFSLMAESAKSADVILLAPQVRFKLEEVKKSYPDKLVMAVDMADYGMMAGDRIVEKILAVLNK